MIAFGEAVTGAPLICRPAGSARTASGWVQIGWVLGPVSAELHHWLVGSAWPARSPAWVGDLVGVEPGGSVSAMLPRPVTLGTSSRGAATPSVRGAASGAGA